MSIFTYNPNASRLGVSNRGGPSIGYGASGGNRGSGRVRVGRAIRESGHRLGALVAVVRGKPGGPRVKYPTYITPGKPLPPLVKPLPTIAAQRITRGGYYRAYEQDQMLDGLDDFVSPETSRWLLPAIVVGGVLLLMKRR